MVRQKIGRNSTNRDVAPVNAATTIDEAQAIVRRIIRYESGQRGRGVDDAIAHASRVYDINQSKLVALWKRRSRKFIEAHVYLQLKKVEAWLEERAATERRIMAETAEILEQRGSHCAGLARKAAELAGAQAGMNIQGVAND